MNEFAGMEEGLSELWWRVPLGIAVCVGVIFLWGAACSAGSPPPERTETCHACGYGFPASQTVRVGTSSDPRSAGTVLCRGCFEERILSERWAGAPGEHWFNRFKRKT